MTSNSSCKVGIHVYSLGQAIHRCMLRGAEGPDDAMVEKGKALCVQPPTTAARKAARSTDGNAKLGRLSLSAAILRENMENLIRVIFGLCCCCIKWREKVEVSTGGWQREHAMREDIRVDGRTLLGFELCFSASRRAQEQLNIPRSPEVEE